MFRRKTIENRNWIFFAVIGIEFGCSIIGGLLLGGYADKKFETPFPLFTLLGLVCGVVAGMVFLLRALKLKDKEDGNRNEEV